MTTVAHDARGFERMYRRHVSAVYRYALAVIGNQADAEDATQQTFLSAYRAWERGERPRRAHNWLITIAHNVCRQRFRERSRRPAEVELEADAVPTSVDERLEAADLTTALGQLQFNQRAALVMRELEGRSYDEIAGTLGVSHSAVETLLFRARRALREQLEGELTCGEAERALSRRLDGELPRAEAAALRAHTRACADCATLERRMRARRAALRGLAFPLPSSLGSFGGGATTAASGGLLAKGAAVLAVGALVAGAGTHALDRRPHAHAAALPTMPATAVTTSRVAVRHAPRRETRTTAVRRLRGMTKPRPSPHAAARPQRAAPRAAGSVVHDDDGRRPHRHQLNPLSPPLPRRRCPRSRSTGTDSRCSAAVPSSRCRRSSNPARATGDRRRHRGGDPARHAARDRHGHPPAGHHRDGADPTRPLAL